MTDPMDDPFYRAAITNAVFAVHIDCDPIPAATWFGPGIGHIEIICGYNPQRLLPAPRKIVPRKVWERFTTPTGRWATDRIPHLFPGEEIKLMKVREPTFKMPEIDFGHAEARALVGMLTARKFTASFQIATEGIERFTRQLRTARERMDEYWDRINLISIHAGVTPSPMFEREYRIATLLSSRDRRQRRRGERLFKVWRRTRPGINYQRHEPVLRSFYDTQLGEPWDPTRYRKD